MDIILREPGLSVIMSTVFTNCTDYGKVESRLQRNIFKKGVG